MFLYIKLYQAEIFIYMEKNYEKSYKKDSMLKMV